MPDIRPAGSDSVTVLGSDCTFKGELSFEHSMRIEGKVEGKIASKGKLALGKGAHLTADVTVGQIQIEGSFKGNLTATERVELSSSANVLGDIRAPKLVIAEGATFVGNCHVSPDALKGADKSEFVVPVPATPIKK
jgi:cytoskeletal protein CcmA (bactofilin family)